MGSRVQIDLSAAMNVSWTIYTRYFYRLFLILLFSRFCVDEFLL